LLKWRHIAYNSVSDDDDVAGGGGGGDDDDDDDDDNDDDNNNSHDLCLDNTNTTVRQTQSD